MLVKVAQTAAMHSPIKMTKKTRFVIAKGSKIFTAAQCPLMIAPVNPPPGKDHALA